MPESGSYTVTGPSRELDRELQRLRAQALFLWEKERRTLAGYGLQDGMSLLELGSGPGFVTEQLLAWLPASRITALELSPTLIEKARRYLGDGAGDRLQFVEASIMDTGLPDNSADFALARFLFQHLPDPVSAAREVHRILKPGGKLVIEDCDDAVWGLCEPDIPQMGLILEKYGQAQAVGGGNRRVGRQLWRILEAAGFANLDMNALVAHSDALGLEPFLPQFDLKRISSLEKSGALSEPEMAQIRMSHEALFAAERPFILMINFMACGQKVGRD
jgi:ubiquinone/menaquinone biosynthesis C-methylase UbiE